MANKKKNVATDVQQSTCHLLLIVMISLFIWGFILSFLCGAYSCWQKLKMFALWSVPWPQLMKCFTLCFKKKKYIYSSCIDRDYTNLLNITCKSNRNINGSFKQSQSDINQVKDRSGWVTRITILVFDGEKNVWLKISRCLTQLRCNVTLVELDEEWARALRVLTHKHMHMEWHKCHTLLKGATHIHIHFKSDFL